MHTAHETEECNKVGEFVTVFHYVAAQHALKASESISQQSESRFRRMRHLLLGLLFLSVIKVSGKNFEFLDVLVLKVSIGLVFGRGHEVP